MASGTRLARLKMLEDDSVPKRKTRKLKKLCGPSPLDEKKLKGVGKKMLDSPPRRSIRTERGGPSSIYTNAKKHASPTTTKNKKEEERIGPSISFNIANKCASPLTKKRKEVEKSVSSSTDNSSGSASSQIKMKIVDENSRILGGSENKSEENGKKTIRKHLHVRTYKRLVTKQANKGGNQGGSDTCLKENVRLQGGFSDLKENISKEAQVHGDAGSMKGYVEDQMWTKPVDPLVKEGLENTKLLADTFDASFSPDVCNQECGTKLFGSEGGIKLESNIFVESSRKEMPIHDLGEANLVSPSPIIEELGISGSGVCDAECLGTTCAEENINIESIVTSQSAAAFISNLCVVCKQPGQLICCCGKGCNRSYHLSCLDPLLHDVPPGAWLCNFCVKKKMESGVYSVSEGIESVWDVDEGMQSGKHYFVKYKGLAHVHNRWIPESKLLCEAPFTLDRFRKKGQKEKVTKWRKEWAEPERLLQKRLVVPPDVADECTSGSATESSCYIEWFVKWKGLQYDQATWELEDSLLLCSPVAAGLIEAYELRHEQARKSRDPLKADKGLHIKKGTFCKLSELPKECPAELDNVYLSSVNRLREFWHKSVNALLIDDQDRITKSILFILSLQSHTCLPSLIITTSSYLPLWQGELARLAPSLNVVLYKGSKDVRKMIQNLEFYEESGCIMFGVLLAEPDAIIEDLSDITCIGWEALIVDTCHNSKTSRYLDRLKFLATDFKLLLFNAQLKDSLSEYRLLLSFINNEETVDDGSLGLKLDTNEATGALAIVKEKLAHYIANERKADASMFFEYWVPVPLSNVQLEQYCAALISNSNVLRSNSKSDVVGALHNILVTTRKCCDHPYLVDGELRGLLTKGLHGVEFLNAEVCASGKLFLLDKILQEIKSHGLRVVILFQSLGGPGKISLGDILDDFLQQRFGVDSYERIETGLVMTKKVAALKMFNDKEAGRFVFLIEKRACLPSVKLRYVDAIILFDSDWNPLNDLRSLQKINIESQQSCIKVFRLYTSFTVEEKLLMFAKQDTILESNIESISRNVTLSLLGWGASYLFRKLEQFHCSASPTCISEPSFDKLCLNDVISEILTELQGISETTRTVPCSILIKARQSGATYPRNIVMVGEKEGISFPDKDPASFWSGLLEGRHPRWIHISERSQRIRRKVQNLDGSVKMQEVESDEVKKKRRKTNNVVYPVMPFECSQENGDASKGVQKNRTLESDGGEPKLEEQRNLLMLLRPELSKLCDILGLPASVKGLAQEFLVYIMNNHDVCSKQVTVLQALKIALCWRAASMSRHNLDRIQSLALAKKHFKFECTEEEAYSVYSRLRILKEKFPCKAGALKNLKVLNSFDNQSPLPEKADAVTEPLYQRAVSGNSDLGVIGSVHDGQESSEQLISQQQGRYLILDAPMKVQKDDVSVKEKLLKDQIDLIEQIFLRRSEDLRLKQQEEVSHFEKQMYKERLKLEKAHDLDSEFIDSIHIDSTVRNGKMKVLTQESSAKMGRFFQHLKQQKEKFMSMQLDSRNKEQELKNSWLAKAKACQLEESFDDVPLMETGFRLEKFKEASKYNGNCYNPVTTMFNSAHPSEETNTELGRAPPGDNTESEESFNEDTSSILSGREGNIIPSDDAFASQSVIMDNLESIEQIISAVEPSVVLPGLVGVQPMNAEISNPQPEFLNIIDSLARTDIHAEQQDGDNSNGPHFVPNPVINKGTLLSSVQGLACSVTASNLSPVQTVVPAEQAADVVNEPTSQQIPEKAVNLSRSEDLPERTPSPHLGNAGIQQEVACAQSYFPAQQTEYPAQQIAVAAVVDNEPPNQMISENIVHPLRSQEDVLPSERTPSELLRSTSVQRNHRNQLLQNVPSMGWYPTQPIYADPFQNELLRIRKQDDSCAKKHEDKKLKLQFECELEIENVRRKYDSLLHDVEREYLQDKRIFQTLYDKVLLNKILAEDIRDKFYDHRERLSTSSQGPSQNLSLQVQASPLQPWLPSRPSSVSPPEPSSNTTSHPSTPTINQASTSSFLPTTRSRSPAPVVASMHSTGFFSQPSQVISSNTVRGSTTRPSPQVGRAPAPHLHRFRPLASPPASGVPLAPATCQPPLPDSTVSAPAPSVPPPMDLSSALPATSSTTQPSISPASSVPPMDSPLYVTAPLVKVHSNVGPDLLESLLSNFPSTGNEFPTENMVDSSTPNALGDVICLSDDECPT